jgi:hypothetical protein
MTYATEKWHNLRITRRNANSESVVVTTDFERTLAEAVESNIFHNLGVVDIVSVEWKDPDYMGKNWRDVTETFRNMFHEGTHYERE